MVHGTLCTAGLASSAKSTKLAMSQSHPHFRRVDLRLQLPVSMRTLRLSVEPSQTLVEMQRDVVVDAQL
jgi:hypothetical protein